MRSTIRSFLLLILILAGVGVYRLVIWQKPNLFDAEQANVNELNALKNATLSPAAPTSADWPQWFGPNRDGRAPAGSLRTDWVKEPPTVLWSVPGGGGYSSFAVVGKRVYTHDRINQNDRVRCLDAETGKDVWVHESPQDYGGISYGSGPRATPTVHEGKVYALTGNGVLLCLDEPKEAGKPPTLAWSIALTEKYQAPTPTWGFASSPLIVDDMVIVQPGAKSASVAAFDRRTGEPRWTAGDEPSGYSSPVVATCAGVKQVIAVTGMSIRGLHAANGNALWRHDWQTQHNGNIAAAVVAGDYVFVSSNYGKGCVLLHLVPDGGGVKAETVYFRKGRVMLNHHSTCVLRDGYLYGFDMNVLRCVNLRSGEASDEWVARDDTGRAIAKGAVILADKQILGLTETGTLFLADADPEEFRFRGKLEKVLNGRENWALPVLVDGRIYLRDGEKVVCLDARPKAATP